MEQLSWDTVEYEGRVGESGVRPASTKLCQEQRKGKSGTPAQVYLSTALACVRTGRPNHAKYACLSRQLNSLISYYFYTQQRLSNMKMRWYVRSDEEGDTNGFLIRGAWLEELGSIP